MKLALQAKIRAGLSARVILIMITVTATTGGFILGYLVGKKTSDEVNIAALKQPSVDSSLQKNENTPAEDMPTQGQATAQTSVTQSPTTHIKDTVPSSATTHPASTQEQKTPAANEAPGISAGPSSAQNTGKEKTLEPASDIKSDSNKNSSSTIAPLSGDNAYFVQAGAFSSRSKADGLKHTLDGKGYKTTIRKWVSKRHKTFYKVIAGEFSRKEEAEILALRLRKTEGLSASVIKR